jgi:hypothetical protein
MASVHGKAATPGTDAPSHAQVASARHEVSTLPPFSCAPTTAIYQLARHLGQGPGSSRGTHLYLGTPPPAVSTLTAQCAERLLLSSLGDAKSSLGDTKSSLGDAESSLGDAESSLGDATSSLGDAKSSLGGR